MRQSRRSFLKTTGLLGTTAASGVLVGTAGAQENGATEDDPLSVAVYGGIFQEVMDEELFGPFTEDTGIPAESQAQATAEVALSQYEGAIRAGEAPVDVAIMATTGVIRGENSELWHHWDEGEFENTEYVTDDLLRFDEADDGLVSVGALSWYINLVRNEDVLEDELTSWEDLWDSTFEGELGLLGLASNSFLLDITAVTHFDDQEILDSREGVEEVFEVLEDVKPQAAMWYENEAEFQQRLIDQELGGGMFYHDISLVLVDDGVPVDSQFVEEGSVLDSGSWVTLEPTDKLEDARAFIDYASQPDVQDRLAQSLYTSPTIDREHSSLDDEEYERIAGPGPEEAITPRYELYVEEEEWVNELWNEFIIG